jgi:hypothetical protein
MYRALSTAGIGGPSTDASVQSRAPFFRLIERLLLVGR